jgi:arsenite oxidase small subunit
MQEKKNCSCLTRRQFLLGTGGATATIILRGLVGYSEGKTVALQTSRYPRKKIAKLSDLKQDLPVLFRYPHDHYNCTNILIRLGVPAEDGVGPHRDVVAFNTLCTHMGGPLMAAYQKDHKVLGPCSFHLSMFDLTKRGIITTGSATQSLPQIMLEVKGDEIHAVGVMGLIFGFSDNMQIAGRQGGRK